jgi:putative FmdB family regulatory protein
MINYHYRCSTCGFEDSIRQSIKDVPLTHCEGCNNPTLQRVIHSPANAFVRGEPKTIGQLMDKNTREMGHYEFEDRRRQVRTQNGKYVGPHSEKANTANRLPFMGPMDDNGKLPDVDKLNTKEKLEKYLFEGKEPL